MSHTALTDTPLLELAARVNGGLEVTLLWDETDDTTSIHLQHPETDVTFRFNVPPARALDAFRHPFAYLGNLT